jgi:outer membrane receptor protein involved in Fe transport
MCNRLLTLLGAAVLLSPIVASAQSSVTGVVRDGATGTPLKGATLMLRDRADSTARPLGAVSDASGAFSIDHVVIGKRYALEAAFVGYDKLVREDVVVTAGKPSLDVGVLSLHQSPIESNGVEVTSQREHVVIRADKTIYDIENNPVYTATNVSELLAQIPSVSVDQDGKVSLRGNGNVTIMMNDRPLTMPGDQLNKFLQSLPANMVKDIEIRTNPGAQFDAKYEGGIINIVTRRTMSDMFGGSVNAGTDTKVGANGGAGLYYNGGDLNASLGGGVYYGPNHGSSSSLRINYADPNERRDEGVGSSESTSNSLYGYGQVDYKLSEQDLASVSFNLNHWASDYSSDGAHTFFNAAGDVIERYYDSSAPGPHATNAGGYNSGSLLLKHTFSADHKLSLDVSLNSNAYKGESNYTSTYYHADGTPDSARNSGRNTSYDQSNTTIITSLAYENTLSDAFTLSAGGKNEINRLDNSTSVSNRDRGTGEFVIDSQQTNHYLPHNSIYAVYGELGYRPIQAIGLQAGIRYERANVSARYASGQTIISRDYSNVFPSGSIAYTINPQHTLTFSYRRSVALPDIDALNPAKLKWSDYVERSGNPDLEPEFTQTFELAYNTFWGMGNMITLSPYYSTTAGSIESSEQLINNVSTTTYENFNGAYSIGSELSLGLKPLQWLTLRLSGNLYQKVNRGSAIPGDIHSSATGYDGNAMFNADITQDLALGVNGFFREPPTVGATKNSGYMMWSFSLRQRLFDKKLNISLRVNDPFNLQKWEIAYNGPDFRTEASSKWSSRFVALNVSYSFGTTPHMESHKQDKSDTKGGGSSGGGGGQGGGQ